MKESCVVQANAPWLLLGPFVHHISCTFTELRCFLFTKVIHLQTLPVWLQQTTPITSGNQLKASVWNLGPVQMETRLSVSANVFCFVLAVCLHGSGVLGDQKPFNLEDGYQNRKMSTYGFRFECPRCVFKKGLRILTSFLAAVFGHCMESMPQVDSPVLENRKQTVMLDMFLLLALSWLQSQLDLFHHLAYFYINWCGQTLKNLHYLFKNSLHIGCNIWSTWSPLGILPVPWHVGHVTLSLPVNST